MVFGGWCTSVEGVVPLWLERLGLLDHARTIRLQIFEASAVPGHCHLWFVAALSGLDFKPGPVDQPDDELDWRQDD